MTFQESIRVCFQKYVDFNGTASRSEYWWFFLFCLVVSVVLGGVLPFISWIFSLATLLPSLSAGARRLHDTGRSGWWQLLWLVPAIGWIVVIIFLAQEGKASAQAAAVSG